VGDEIGEERVEMLDGHRAVAVPPHQRLGRAVAHHELVLCAASGMRSGVGDEGAVRRDPRFAPLQRLLVELRRAEIPVDRGEVAEAEPLGAEACVAQSVLDHVSDILRGASMRVQDQSKPLLPPGSTRQSSRLPRANTRATTA
jgi:hypothetical protein